MTLRLEIWTPEQRKAHEEHPETIKWNAYLKRSKDNARFHCGLCGRFVSSDHILGWYGGWVTYECSKCGRCEVDQR